MQNVIISDVDGTIIKHHHGIEAPRSVSAQDAACMQGLIKAGHILVMSTGRDYKSVAALMTQERIDMRHGYYITSNGAQIYDGYGNLLLSKPLSHTMLKKAIQIFLDLKDSEHLLFHVFDGKETMDFKRAEVLSRKDQLAEKKIISLCVFSERGCMEDVKEFLQVANSQLIEATVTQNQWYVDVLPMECSKASAIAFVLDRIRKENADIYTMAIGDSWIDICMFSEVDESFTFYSSAEDVRDCAKHLVHHFYEAVAMLDHLMK